jgi:hypothetical protein
MYLVFGQSCARPKATESPSQSVEYFVSVKSSRDQTPTPTTSEILDAKIAICEHT